MGLKFLKATRIVFVFVIGLALKVDAQESKKVKIRTDSLVQSDVWGGALSHIKSNLNKRFQDFKHNDIYVFAGMGLAKQNIDIGNYSNGFNYSLNDFQKNIYKPGFLGGIRFDGIYKEKHLYSFAFSLNKVSTGTNISNGIKISPFVGDFITIKPEDQFVFFNFASHYKKIVKITDTSKYKLYVVVGPSFDWRLSGQSLDNQVHHNYKQIQIKGDLGLEFDNKTYYTLFLHYYHSLTSITKQPINTSYNAFEMGIILKAKDLF